ncbi:tetratricopeptide repeat protein [Campylobacter cuniculorum]|uniref:LicD/FKTN/FKRP nucleotidyltransferase domain-containing protein n=2 Tax=Campylobacter cuniculorum TaxID=374106 RepID=A0A1W6BXY3_9BACT|nr:LicD family protein [Campylobacter cuniculorum]ARJ56900.1 hypothetical protein CCUN_1311 [Campylobacter cuniculorum DSM 23162 = LMG 24588]QOR04360.1 LicD family protein [Campylobacter cuniculorum]
MTFKSLVKKTYRETKNSFFLTRMVCLIVNIYLGKLSNHKKALTILNVLKFLKQNIAYFYLAQLAYIYNNLTQSLSYINIFLKSSPNHADAIYFKCDILSLCEQKNEAFNLLENLLQNSSRIKTWMMFAKLVQDNQDLKRLLNLYKQNIDNYPKFKQKHDEILKAFAKAAINIKDFTLAKKFAKEALFIFMKKGAKAHFISKEAMRLEDAKEALSELRELLEENHIQMFLISGTFLGCIREKNILSHDYDIDVGVYYTDLKKLREIFIESKNFILKSYTYEGGVQIYHINGVYIDVFLHYEENGFVYHNGDFMRWRNTPFELISYDFLGRKYLGPKNYDLYLKENYGLDWKIPKNSTQFNSFLDTPNIEILDENRMIIFLYELLFKTFAIKNEKQILNALKTYGEEGFVKEYLNLKQEQIG